MGNLTFVLDEDVERRLRTRAAQLYGTRRGALSASIQQAIENWLQSPKTSPKVDHRVFLASHHDRPVAKAENLYELAAKLRKAGINPRSVEIHSSEPQKETVRIGMRVRAK